MGLEVEPTTRPLTVPYGSARIGRVSVAGPRTTPHLASNVTVVTLRCPGTLSPIRNGGRGLTQLRSFIVDIVRIKNTSHCEKN